MESVEQVLQDHGLTRETAKEFVALSPLYNKKDLAAELGVAEKTVHRYKQAFWEMDEVTRYRVMAVLMDEYAGEAVNDDR